MPSKKKVVKGEEELTPTLQGGLPLFTELPRRDIPGNLELPEMPILGN
jgi:hypothetical protein